MLHRSIFLSILCVCLAFPFHPSGSTFSATFFCFRYAQTKQYNCIGLSPAVNFAVSTKTIHNPYNASGGAVFVVQKLRIPGQSGALSRSQLSVQIPACTRNTKCGRGYSGASGNADVQVNVRTHCCKINVICNINTLY